MLPTEIPKRDLVLDFWRGASILMVLLQHIFYYHYHIFRQFVETAVYTSSLFHNSLLFGDKILIALAYRSGDLGVRIFFVISGYIITTLLLKEEAKNGHIDAGKFYFRRIFRILPPYFTYLLCLVIFTFLGWVQFDLSQLPYAFGFLCNTDIATCGWNIAHTWTLAIEEQFYILWPLFFLVLPRRFRTQFLVALIVILLSLSSAGILVAHTWLDNAICFVCIATGALYALNERFRTFVQKRGIMAAGALLVFILILDVPLHMGTVAHFLFREVTPFFIIVCLVATYSLTWFTRSRVFLFITKIGLISYSLYIWQAVFTNFPGTYPTHSFLEYPILMFVVATASYLLIERPAMAWSKAYLKGPELVESKSS